MAPEWDYYCLKIKHIESKINNEKARSSHKNTENGYNPKS